MLSAQLRRLPLAMKIVLEQLVPIRYAAKTLFLFTYTDYKTIFIPVAVFACVSAPVHSVAHIVHGLMWIWIHLLQCNTSNQSRSRAEDAVNRPWRPIPSGRISERHVVLLRLGLVPLCIGLSAIYGWDVALASALLTATTVIYDEFSLAGHWVGKNACNILGYASFEIGATKVMGLHRQFDNTATLAVLCSATVIFTTIQAQDFSDTAGDAMLGRVTFPMSYPRFSRLFTFAALIAWSVFLSYLWELGTYCILVFCGLGIYVGLRYYRLREVKDDMLSYKIYNVSNKYSCFEKKEDVGPC